MDSKVEAAEQSTTTTIPVLPLILSSSSSSSSVSAPPSPKPSGTVTPPLRSATATVPFRWEQEPGKPKHSTAVVPFSNSSLTTTTTTDLSPKSLELPPRLLTAENPPHGLGSSNRFLSPSLRNGSDRYGSFRAERSRIPIRAVIRSRQWVGFRVKRQWFWSWRAKKGKVSGGGYVLPSYGGDHRETSDVDAIGGTRKNSGLLRRIWEGLKQMGEWRS